MYDLIPLAQILRWPFHLRNGAGAAARRRRSTVCVVLSHHLMTTTSEPLCCSAIHSFIEPAASTWSLTVWWGSSSSNLPTYDVADSIARSM
jgi:hypothetical protein